MMLFDDIVSDGKSQPCTSMFTGYERVEDFWQDFGINAWTSILHRKEGFILLGQVAGMDSEATSRLHDLYCIEEEIKNDLTDLIRQAWKTWQAQGLERIQRLFLFVACAWRSMHSTSSIRPLSSTGRKSRMRTGR